MSGFAYWIVGDGVDDEVLGAVVRDLMRLTGLENEGVAGFDWGGALLIAHNTLARDDMVELPLRAVRMIRIRRRPGRNARDLDVEGWRSRRSVDSGLRPRATETSRLEPVNLPLGDFQLSSAMAFVLTLCMMDDS